MGLITDPMGAREASRAASSDLAPTSSCAVLEGLKKITGTAYPPPALAFRRAFAASSRPWNSDPARA